MLASNNRRTNKIGKIPMKTKITFPFISLLTYVILLFASPQTSHAQTVTVYLQIADIPGSSTDLKHKNWIECRSFSGGLSQPSSGSVSSTGGHAAGRADFDNLKVLKFVDKASPKLALFTAKGQHISQVKLEVVTNDKDRIAWFTINLTDAMIQSVTPTGSTSEMWEEVSFSFGKIDWTVVDTDPKTGKPKGTIKGTWDLTLNKGS